MEPNVETRPPSPFVSMASAGVFAVIPAFNEERFIASVVFKTTDFVDHVIVVDDGSTDGTAEMAGKAGAIVLSLPHNSGKAAALSLGFSHALAHGSNAIVTIDGDSQHNPAEIPAVVEPILTGQADVVVGSRFLLDQTRRSIPRWRKFGQRALNLATNTFSGVKITDTQSGFRAFSPAAAEALRLNSVGLSVESEMQFLFGPAGLKIMEVPVSARYEDGNKRNPVVHGLEVVDAILSLVARRRPLMFFSLPGTVFVAAGLASGLRVIYVMRTVGTLPVGTTVFTSLLVMAGITLAVTGLILHSIGHLVSLIKQEIAADFLGQAGKPHT